MTGARRTVFLFCVFLTSVCGSPSEDKDFVTVQDIDDGGQNEENRPNSELAEDSKITFYAKDILVNLFTSTTVLRALPNVSQPSALSK